MIQISYVNTVITQNIESKRPNIAQKTKAAIQVKLRKQTPTATPLSKKIIAQLLKVGQIIQI